MKNFESFKGKIKNTGNSIKKAVIIGSILLSAEQGISQNIPNTKDKYIPDKNWKFDKEAKKLEATKKSLLYPGYYEDYLLSDDDTTYNFSGYVTENGETIRTLEDINQDISKIKEMIIYYSDSLKIKEAYEYQSTPEYREGCYNKALEQQENDIRDEKKAIEDFKSLSSAKNKDIQYYKKINDLIAEHEEKCKGLNDYLIDKLKDKEKAVKDPSVVPTYTYEEKVSQFSVMKKVYENKLKNLLNERDYTEKYINNHKENK
jgi:hypothetical protein